MADKLTTLITGASNGIGKELAIQFARGGDDLVLTARSREKLVELAAELEKRFGVTVRVIRSDLREPGASGAIAAQLKQLGVRVDRLVNNAGFGVYGEFLHTDRERELGMIDLNIRALTEMTKRFLPAMVERGRGGVLNVASTAAFQPGPLMAVYYATKAYVLSFSEALDNEVKGTGVTVTALCPGPTKTGFAAAADLGASKLFKSGLIKTMSAESVAREGYEGFLQGRPLVVPGRMNRLTVSLVRFMPRRLVPAIVRRIQERKSRGKNRNTSIGVSMDDSDR